MDFILYSINTMKNRCAGFFLLAVLALWFDGCRQSNAVISLEKKEIFTLSYGNFEDQLNVFDLADISTIKIPITMRDGFFYIVNSKTKKIMQMNTYGDLITFYYNPLVNPSPSYAKTKDVRLATRRAVEYDFNELSCVAVDSHKQLYVVDKLPLDRQEQDSQSRQVLNEVVLRFGSDGHFKDYVGQHGPGDTPFPPVKSIHTTNRDEFVVVSYANDGYIVYWFSSDGYLLYKVPIENQNMPSPYKDDVGKLWHSIGNIVPDYHNHRLYVKIDYYASYVDEASRLQSGVTFTNSYIYELNVEDGTFGDPLEVLPYTEQISEGFSNSHYEIPYDFLGVTENGWLFFLLSTADGFDIQMVQREGKRILKRHLLTNKNESLYYTFTLSNNGILSGLFIKEDKASVDWWRTDSLIQSIVTN